MNAPLKILALVIAALALSACGGGDGGAPDTQAPSATIIFPPAVSLTEADRVTVRGTASDNGTIAAVRVNGIDAISIDGFATWQVSVPLASGQNTLTVETVDMASNINNAAADAIITHDLLWASPVATAVDSANNRAFVIDDVLDAVVAVDLTTGARTILSDASTPNTDNPFSLPRGIALDSANTRAVVVDSGLDAVVAVDLITGARTILSDASTPNTDNPFDVPQGIAIDSGRALVTDSGRAVVAVDLSTGARTILSDPNTPNTDNPFSAPVGITVDNANNSALVVDAGLSAAVAVDLTTGARTILSDASTPDGANPFLNPTPVGIATLNGNNKLALVIDDVWGGVLMVDMTTGERVMFSK